MVIYKTQSWVGELVTVICERNFNYNILTASFLSLGIAYLAKRFLFAVDQSKTHKEDDVPLQNSTYKSVTTIVREVTLSSFKPPEGSFSRNPVEIPTVEQLEEEDNAPLQNLTNKSVTTIVGEVTLSSFKPPGGSSSTNQVEIPKVDQLEEEDTVPLQNLTNTIETTIVREVTLSSFKPREGSFSTKRGDIPKVDQLEEEGNFEDDQPYEESSEEESVDDESAEEENSDEESSEKESSEIESSEESSEEESTEESSDEHQEGEGEGGKRRRRDSKSHDDDSPASKKKRHICDDCDQRIIHNSYRNESHGKKQDDKLSTVEELTGEWQEERSTAIYDKSNYNGQKENIQIYQELEAEYLPVLTVPLEFIYQILPLNM